MAYDPVPMLKMVLYQYFKGRLSPATWYEEAKLNDAMRWLGRGYQPGRRTWYDFRDRVGGAIERLNEQLVKRAIQQGHLDPTTAAQDGTFVAACASRHRMINEETLMKRQSLLRSVIDGIAAPDEILPRWLPRTDSGRQELARRMETAAKILAHRIETNAAKPSGKRKDPMKIVVSLSDPIAPLGRDKMKVYRPLYNVQYMVAPISNLIMSYCCEAAVSDVGMLIPMIDKTQTIVAGRLQAVLADAAYCSILDLRDCEERNIELLAPVQANAFTEKKQQSKANTQIPREQFLWNEAKQMYQCPAGHPLTYQGRERRSRHGDRFLWQHRFQCSALHCGPCPLAATCLRTGACSRTIKRLEGQELLDAQREKMNTEEAKRRYGLRGQTVERGFADGKANRRWSRFHGRGLQRVRAETGLMVLTQNALILERLERSTLNSNESTT